MRCKVSLDHLQTEIFCLREDKIYSREEDDEEDAEHEEGSIERKITFKLWVKLD